MIKKKLLGVCICISMISCMQLSACSACSKTNEIVNTESEKPEPAEPAERTPDALKFSWDPYKFNDELLEFYGELARDDYHNVVDAIVNQEESCYCTADFSQDLMSILEVMFPPSVELFSYSRDEEGYLHFTYNKTKEEQDAVIAEFKKQMKSIVKGYLYEGDSDAMIAVELFKRYAAVAGENASVSIYTHLCIQCGIQAWTEKDWTYILLDGNKYYVDVVGSSKGENMACFGVSKSEDLRFEELHRIVSSAAIDRSGKEIYIVGYDDSMNQIRVKVE